MKPETPTRHSLLHGVAQRCARARGWQSGFALLAATACAVAAAPSPPASSLPVCRYAFDEGTGFVAHDSSPNRLDAVAYRAGIRAADWSEGHTGKAIRLGGTEEGFLRLPRAVLREEPQSGVLEFWVKPEKDERGVIFGKHTTGWGHFYVAYSKGGGIEFQLQGNRISSSCRTKPGNIPLKQWSHVRIVWDIGDANRVFVNGKERAASNPIRWVGGHLDPTIGCLEPRGQDPKVFFTGLLDEFSIGVAAEAVADRTGESPKVDGTPGPKEE